MSIPSLSNLGLRSEMSGSGSADQQISRAFYDLCALLLTILRSPPGAGPPPQPRQSAAAAARRNHLTPAELASLLLGVSLTLMLCGSVTFMIGFMLMPWVLGLVMVFYFFGIVSSLSGFGRAMLCPGLSSGSRTSPREMHEETWKLIAVEYGSQDLVGNFVIVSFQDASFPRFPSFRLEEQQRSTLKAMQLIAPKKAMFSSWST